MSFRARRGATAGVPHRQPAIGASSKSPVEDLGKYERDGGGDDFRHRMLMNVLAFGFVVLLIIAGVWIADKIAQMRKNQDCVLTGRRGCTPVDVQPRDRF